jgi:hypothetical protein
MTRIVFVTSAAFLAGCAMTGERLAADGVAEHQIVCGGISGVCESKAAEICPAGFNTLSKAWTVNGYETWIRCQS